MMKDSKLYRFLIRPDGTTNGAYNYSPLMVALLSRIAEVPEENLRKTKLYPRTPRRYIPFYSADKGGGAITLGNKKWHSITYTENFFSNDTSLYRRAYADNTYTWLRMSAHEVGHVNHAIRYGSIIIYLIVFIYQYARYGHDGAPLEKEADLGPDNLNKLIRHTAGQLIPVIESDLPEEDKIKQIVVWWTSYKRSVTP